MLLQCMRRVLIVGKPGEELRAQLRAEGVETHEVGQSGQPASFPEHYFDAILLNDPALLAPSLDEALQRVLPALSPWGALYLANTSEPGRPVTAILESLGLRHYLSWSLNAGGVIQICPLEQAGQARTVMAVRQTYDPVVHARQVFKAGKPEWSYEILANVPGELQQDLDTYGRICAERQLCLLAWDRSAGPEGRLSRFGGEQREFYDATNALPCLHQAYLCHATFWRLIGNGHMANRILRSIQHVAPSDAVANQLARYPLERPEPLIETAPRWTDGQPKPRLLFLCHEHSDYGFDCLYDGLVRILGADHIVEYPWKPTLHGQAFDKAYNYPCTFNHPGEPRSLEWICEALRWRQFDAICYVDTLMELDKDRVRTILDAAGDTPLVILDTWDEPGDYLPDILHHLGQERAAAQFKREMLACGTYSPNTFPLPFPYADSLVPGHIPDERTEPLFWAGKRQDGMRRLYIEYLEVRFGWQMGRKLPQEEYARALDNAIMGLNLFGLGFDTVRYWELPAHGCMLLSERSPLRIPHNFVDGETAVFFDDLPELEEKLIYYFDHLAQARAIARQGHEHFIKHHTASARARQFLGYLAQCQITPA